MLLRENKMNIRSLCCLHLLLAGNKKTALRRFFKFWFIYIGFLVGLIAHATIQNPLVDFL